MENLRKIREPVRSAFTREVNTIQVELASPTPNREEIEASFAFLEEKVGELEVADQKILDALILDDAPEEEYAEECEAIDGIRKQFLRVRVKVNSLYAKDTKNEDTESIYTDAESGRASKNKIKLPKIELQKFGGELKDWLCFWSLFRKFHEDPDIDPEDKFQYLLQAITPGSRARELIDSYPPTAENYPKVVESLKQRFGRDDLLVEVYVRELVRLVMQNATNPKEKITVTKLYDQIESHIRSLGTLGVTTEKCAAILYPLVESCLPEDILRAWQRCPPNSASSKEDASGNRLTHLLDFLRSEVEGEERIRMARAGFGLGSKKEKHQKEKEVLEEIPTAAGLFSGEGQQSGNQKELKCLFCEKKHLSQDCFQAQKMQLPEKRNQLQKKRGCFCCLKIGHTGKECRQQIKCVVCSQKHYPIMCPELSRRKDQPSGIPPDEARVTKPALANMSNSPEVLLKTLIVRVNYKGRSRQARVVIDDGSHKSYILKSLAEEIGLSPAGREPLIHALFGGATTLPVNHLRYRVPISNLDESFKCEVTLLDQPTICSNVPKVPRGPWLGELQKRKIWVTDVGTDGTEVDILLGADVAGGLLTGRVCHLKSGLVAVETRLGWTLMGEVPGAKPSETAALQVTSLLNTDQCISSLWQLETIGIHDPAEVSSRVDLEREAKEHFLKTVRVNEEGRYEVHLPWIEGHPPLKSNLEVAERRLISATKKLEEKGRLEEYDQVIQEWLGTGVVEVVPDEEVEQFGHYLPHRAVFKESSTTTKVRPVFDASAHEKNSPSLNDCLEKGPNLIEKIPPMVIRFRWKRFGASADIAKAFLQIALSRRDRDFVRFLWWADLQKQKKVHLRHRRVVFGISSSPFLLGAIIEYHLRNAPEHLKSIAEVLLTSFYVDNCLTSLNDVVELVAFISDAYELMELGKFDLRGWEHTATNPDSRDEKHGPVPVLGLVWDTKEDTLCCDLSSLEVWTGPVTKRKILSVAQKVFDPLGILSPVTLLPKILLQSTWELKSGWDAELPEEISTKFEAWAKDVMLLGEVRIPRWVTGSESKNVSLHIFSDASKLAYAACVFLRSETARGIVVQLLLAKSRVAPIKEVTIPRLELLSCVIGTRLATMVKDSLEIADIPCHYWSDSTTAISWIQRDEQWSTFVGNRVKEIRKTTSAEQWKHVPGKLNPADLPSRGCSASEIIQSRWWEGPDWLRKSEDCWPKSCIECKEEEINREKKKTVTSLLSSEVGWKIVGKYFERWSSYNKIIRSIAWYSRFLRWKKSKIPDKESLRVDEVTAAERKLLKLVQKEVFQSAPENLAKGIGVIQDEDGLYRIRSKLTWRDEPKDFKYPILLPSKHRVTDLLIQEVHLQNCHAGIQAMLSILRERFWILRARKTVRRVLSGCVRCRRYEAKNLEAVPAALPLDRVREADVFEVVGIDLAGPLFLKGGLKSWVVIFTCAVFRAVHFELVTSLSTEGFMLALRRFVGRRSRPSIIYSDNGTNFVGAENLFQRVDWGKVEIYATALRIQWRFNPPTAAWWGGWWERIVRSLKQHLRRVLGKASLNYEELGTVLVDIEALVNSRPLTYISESMDELCPLTPALFLKDRREEGVPEIDVVDHDSLNKRWQFRQRLREDLRKRFRSEYLGQLVQQAGKKDGRKLQLGDVVLVGSDNQKRIDWPLGKIVELIPGKDGNIRVVKVETAVGQYLRPVQRIFPLEISAPEEVISEVIPPVSVTEDSAKDVSAESSERAETVPESKPAEDLTEPEKRVKIVRTRSGRVIRAPVKFSSSCISLFSRAL